MLQGIVFKAYFSGKSLSLNYGKEEHSKRENCIKKGVKYGEGDGYPFKYSCLGNPIYREAWWATVHRVTKELDTT